MSDLAYLFNTSFLSLYDTVANYAPIWAPLIFGFLLVKIWKYYVETEYISKIKWIMLELRLPKEVYKPPQAMEFILAALDQGSSGSKFQQWWQGRVRIWFSLEMVSIEGVPRFFIRTPAAFKNLIETRIYSQYPDVEINEAPDYTEYTSFDGKGEISIFGTDFVLSKADPLPIKTYVDYGMESFVDENQRIDPLTPLIEFLGSVGPGEQVWFQILIQSSKKRYKKEDGEMGDWRDEAKAEIKKIKEDGAEKPKEGEKADKPQLTKRQNDNIASIERNLAKVGFDCGIRAIYLARKENFNPGNIPALMNAFKQFNSEHLNGFKPSNVTSFDYPWEDVDKMMGNIRLNSLKRKLFNAYRMRSYFYPPYQRKPFVLTTEELATIFRIPSAIAETPTLRRMESKKSEPPANLPI